MVVTAAHFGDSGPFHMLVGTDEYLESSRVSVHATADIMLVEFLSEDYFVPRTMDIRQVAYGEELWLDGYPGGEGPFLRKGYSSGGDRTSTAAWPGDSGGPISDAQGEVVGILVATLMTRHGLVPFAARMVVLADISDWLGKELQHERFIETPSGEVQEIPIGGGDLGEPEFGG